jgi:hypothetical protein
MEVRVLGNGMVVMKNPEDDIESRPGICWSVGTCMLEVWFAKVNEPRWRCMSSWYQKGSGREAERDIAYLQGQCSTPSVICAVRTIFPPCSRNHTVMCWGPEEKVEQMDWLMKRFYVRIVDIKLCTVRSRCFLQHMFSNAVNLCVSLMWQSNPYTELCHSSGVRHRQFTVVAWVGSKVRSRGICGGLRGTGADFLLVLCFPLPIIPPIAPHSSSSIILGWYNRPDSNCHTMWTRSHPTIRKTEEAVHSYKKK